MWFKKSSSEERGSALRELKSITGGSSKDELFAALAVEADKLHEILDPCAKEYTTKVEEIHGEEWVVIDEANAKALTPLASCCSPKEDCYESILEKAFNLEEIKPSFEYDCEGSTFAKAKGKSIVKVQQNYDNNEAGPAYRALGEIKAEEYFGLSDDESIIIQFNIIEHKHMDGRRRFANGIDYPGKIKKMQKNVVIGQEAKECHRSRFMQFIRFICNSIKRMITWTKKHFVAPPRLQALRGCRGSGASGSGGGAPGSGVRAYALHLAADKTTTFAQNVDNFIACTIESKETCPHIVMRNMRQFMSGMKNYLVKHGEREFEKEVEKERLKLKSNEFLNLDAILEGVLHGAVVAPLRGHVYRLLADRFANRGDVALLTAGMRVARTLPALRLGVRPSVRVPSEAEMVVISKYFVTMQEADSPLDKLENLLAAISAIFNAMKAGGGGSTGGGPPLGADDFLPVLVLTLSRCAVAGAELEAELMAGLLPPPLLAGEGGYYLTTLFGAVAVLKRLASPEQDKTMDWRSGSLGSQRMGAGACAGVARVLVPDESAGALRCVALPWRPGARARDLCRALAHRARITNPQDYGLFALRDGEETLLSDGDCPQDLIGDQKSTNCMLAYKRIDAKIAWPKHALQSYP